MEAGIHIGIKEMFANRFVGRKVCLSKPVIGLLAIILLLVDRSLPSMGEDRNVFSRLFKDPTFWKRTDLISTDSKVINEILSISNTRFVALTSCQNHNALKGLRQLGLYIRFESNETTKEPIKKAKFEEAIEALIKEKLLSKRIEVDPPGNSKSPVLNVSVRLLSKEPSAILFWDVVLEGNAIKDNVSAIEQIFWQTCGIEVLNVGSIGKIENHIVIDDLVNRFLSTWAIEN